MNRLKLNILSLGGRTKWILLCGGCLLGLLADGTVSRVLLLWRSERHYGMKVHDYFYYDKDKIFRIQPNSQGWYKDIDEKPILVRSNSEGFRGPELKPSPSHRIIFTGDSIVCNGGVHYNDSFVGQLDGLFRPEGRDVEVINAGTTDVGID